MIITLYIRPNGNTKEIDVQNVYDEDVIWFEQNNAKLSMEELYENQYALYADIGLINDDNEPDEIIVISNGKSCKESFKELRKECEKFL